MWRRAAVEALTAGCGAAAVTALSAVCGAPLALRARGALSMTLPACAAADRGAAVVVGSSLPAPARVGSELELFGRAARQGGLG